MVLCPSILDSGDRIICFQIKHDENKICLVHIGVSITVTNNHMKKHILTVAL